jgi:hypothetical protein
MFAVALAGILPFVWHIGVAGVALLLGGIVAYFKSSLRLTVIRLAILIVIGLILYITGALNEKARCVAQTEVLQSQVDAVVAAAKKPAVSRPLDIRPSWMRKPADKWDRDWRD